MPHFCAQWGGLSREVLLYRKLYNLGTSDSGHSQQASPSQIRPQIFAITCNIINVFILPPTKDHLTHVATISWQIGEGFTVEPVLKDHPIGHKNVICQERLSLEIGSVILKCRSFCQNCVVCQDRWSLKTGFTVLESTVVTSEPPAMTEWSFLGDGRKINPYIHCEILISIAEEAKYWHLTGTGELAIR